MDSRAEIREFLTTRRAKVMPAEVGLPDAGHRRVPGLRRAEVAVLAGVSAEYYARIERGALAGVSPSVLDALCRALRLDDAERAHLEALARLAESAGSPARGRRPGTPRAWRPHPSLQWALDAMTGGPAMVRNGRMEVLATNLLGWAMHTPVFGSEVACSAGPPSLARFTFLDEASRGYFGDWGTAAATCVSILRTEAGRSPHDRAMHDLVGELSTRSPEFAALWSAHDVRLHGTGTKSFHVDPVGELVLAYEGMDMLSAPGLTMTLYSAEPGSPTEQALRLLATWAATERADRARAADDPSVPAGTPRAGSRDVSA